MTITATDRAEINRRNARRSTGPRTAEGKERSRLNALKHGMTARTLILPGEDPEAFQARIEAWTADLQPRNDLEQFLVERAVTASWQLERADRAEAARLACIIRGAPAEEAIRQEEEAVVLGRRLFWDRRGPMALYPHGDLRDELVAQRNPRTSSSGLVDDPDDPVRLVIRLEATAAGCQWMLSRWTELRDLLDQGYPWQSPDKLKAIRLLGHQPIDAADDPDVAEIFLAAWVLDPGNREVDPFAELWKELLPGEENLYKQRLRGREAEDWLPEGEDEARCRLRKIIDRATARLKDLASSHRERADANPAAQADRLSFDGGTEGERLRRYQLGCGRTLFRTLDTLLKLRRSASSATETRDGRGVEDPPPPAETESAADTSATNLFGEPTVNAETLEEEFERIGEKAVEDLDPTAAIAEITVETIGNDRENEPTVRDSGNPIPRKEPVTPASEDRTSQNEAILDSSCRSRLRPAMPSDGARCSDRVHVYNPTTRRSQPAGGSLQ
jgi:hypothetical protein